MTDMCGDNRFEVIEKAKKQILESTNIESSPDEMKVLDSFLFRCWQLGWIGQEVAYICDRKQCADCGDDGFCGHTTDIHHAVNFEEIAPGMYMEKE